MTLYRGHLEMSTYGYGGIRATHPKPYELNHTSFDYNHTIPDFPARRIFPW